jgi:hypothetical protein
MTPEEQYAEQEYNVLIADMFDSLPQAYIESPAGQALI